MTVQEAAVEPMAAGRFALTNARVALRGEVVSGSVAVDGGQIVAVDAGRRARAAIDLGGGYLVPGLVDIHTDHLEKHIFPRAHVRWNPVAAVMAHDALVIAAGITTVFDSLCVGAPQGETDRREILSPALEAIERTSSAGMLRAEHLVHLRCEVVDLETPALAEAEMARGGVRIASVMDHTPGQRQSRDLDALVRRRMAETGASSAAVERRIAELIEEAKGHAESVRPKVVELAREAGLTLLSHDDATVDEVALAHREGIGVSEFPVTIEAAAAARRYGMTTVAGAPNYLRGGSQSGNVSVADLIDAKLVDILASDYVLRSPIDCAFALAADEVNGIDLPQALSFVAANPARICGLADRGEIAPGKRADLVHVEIVEGHPVVRTVWRAGKRVF